MKKEIAIASLLVATVLFMSGCASFKQWEGKASPDFTVTDIDGKTFTLSQQKGKDVVVVILTTKCPFCKMQVPDLIKLRNGYDADRVVIIAISNEDNTELRAFRQEKGVNYIFASTENLPPPYGQVNAIPTFFFIDRNGTIRDTANGYHNFEALKSLVSAMNP